MEKLELSQERIQDIFGSGEALNWAKKVYGNSISANGAKQELSEEEVAFSNVINDMVGKAWKFNSTQAKETIAEVIVKIIEPEIFNAPNEILDALFADGTYGEFDKMRVEGSYKNTLVARENALRTGNVDKSYIDFTRGTSKETHLQIETEYPMSNLRRDGAVGVATLTMFALQEFEARKFSILIGWLDSALVGGTNVFEYTGSMTKTAVDDFTGYLSDYCFEGIPQAIALSNTMRELSRVSGMENFYSTAMKDKINVATMLDIYNGTALNSIKAGKKMGDGNTLLKKDVVLGLAGKIGEKYTKGAMRSEVINDGNSEIISLKFTGVEFGIRIDDLTKVAKLVKKA